jgi:hypothetical protein
MGGIFLKQSGHLPGYEIEHDKFIRENKSESGLQNGPALAGITRPAHWCGPELVAVGMRRLDEISGGGKATTQF